jgi:hypothetical protein
MIDVDVVKGPGAPFFVQALPLLNIILAIFATVRCVRAGQRGLALFLRILFVWLVPVVGPVVTLCVVRRSAAAAPRST